jgi:hypothetical protein
MIPAVHGTSTTSLSLAAASQNVAVAHLLPMTLTAPAHTVADMSVANITLPRTL